MPLAGAHIALTAAVLAAVRKLLKVKFSNRMLILGAVLGLLPDIDIPLAWAVNLAFGTKLYFHKIYTHALIIPFLIFTAAVITKKCYSKKTATIILVVAIAWAVHIMADCYLSVGMVPTLFPVGPELGFCGNMFHINNAIDFDAIAIVIFTIYAAFNIKEKS